ncbi:MAG: ATP-dependent helicase HrpB [Psychromonas sp.]|uniref:ATP-dependent helicase HrpB n=1 Tax=Psychromonas sp. TaxID=1884585 RepID=UPI0039E214D0
MLPIYDFIPQIQETLSKHAALVLQAEPGAGKSTAVPLSLIGAPFLKGKKIILLEPRRVAVKSIAFYLAKLLGEKVGQRIGYQIRNERKISADTVLEIVTEGILTRRLQNDPELSDVGLIIFDEFHERSIHADLALMLALEVQQAYRDNLTLLVMSATIDTDLIANYLNHAPVIKCPGRTYPVEIEYSGHSREYLDQQVMRALNTALNETSTGDILIFLPGQGEIRRAMQLAARQLGSNIELLPLYGGLALSQQELVLSKRSGSQQRVIFSTNIAETSLTIEGICTVIDSGLEKVLSFDVKSGLSRLETTYIAKASATQRAGRAGRLQSGRAIRLYSEAKHQGLKDFQAEEISNTDLSSLVLDLAAWGITSYAEVNWLTPPPEHHFDVACSLNRVLGLLDAHNKITKKGSRALKMGLEPRLASMLLSCQSTLEKRIACVLAALLCERDILFNAGSSDIVERAMLLNDYLADRKSLTSNRNINIGILQQVITQAKSFAKSLGLSTLGGPISLFDWSHYAGALLLIAYPDRLAKIRSIQSSRYLLANGRGVTLREMDSVQGESWLVVCDCDGKNKDGNIYSCAAVSIDQIKTALADQLVEKCHYALDTKKEKVIGRQRLTYRALVLEEQLLSVIPDNEFALCVADILKQEGLIFLNWTKRCASWLARVKWLGSVMADFPKISETTLIEQLDNWLLPYIGRVKTIKQLRQLNIADLLMANLTWQESQTLASQAAEFYDAPSGKSITIRYDQQQGPTVAIILQEMFGQLDSPMLANNTVPIRFELLSPARKPIQTTSDLGNFWCTSYFDVAKDMRGKYPKHRWPEAPLLELPGRSIKKRK